MTSSTGTRHWGYIGSRTTVERQARGEGITVVALDDATGLLDRVQVHGGLVNPSYLALSADGRTLYTVHGDRSEASAFHIDAASGCIERLNTQDTQGRNPVHLCLTPDGRQLLVTNHLGATVALLPLRADGHLGELAQLHRFEGPVGPHRVEQTQAKPHFAAFTPDTAGGAWLLVPDKGLDRVFTLAWRDGRLLGPVHTAVAREGAGPRHLALHPRLDQAYVVNELDSTVTRYALDRATGALQPLQWLPTLPGDYCGPSRAAAIVLHPAQPVLYASNRGHDSVARFVLDAHGAMCFAGTVPTRGATPRALALSPSGRWLLALNEDGHSVTTFAIEGDDGRLVDTGHRFACGSPVCLVFGGVAT